MRHAVPARSFGLAERPERRRRHGMRKTRVFGQLMGVQGMVVGDVTMQPDPDGDGEVMVVSVRTDARSGGKCTYLLEDTCAWLAKNMALTAVTVFLRLSWRTVAAIVARVVQDLTGKTDQLDGLTRIGIDEISYRKGHRYLTCVVDHDTGRLVWAHEGRNKDTLTLFFDAPGPTRSALLTHVSADGAEWIHSV